MDLKKGDLLRVELLLGRPKIVRLVGRFKEGADLRSCNLFSKFGNKSEVGHGAIVLKIFFAETGLLKQGGGVICANLKAGGRLMSLVIGRRRESMQDFYAYGQ